MPQSSRSVCVLFGKAREVLLARLEGGLLGPSSALEIHAEPQDRDEQPGDTGDHVLRDFGALLGAEFANPLVVGVDLGHDRGSVGIAVLHLDDGNGRGGSPSATRQCDSDRKRGQHRLVHLGPSILRVLRIVSGDTGEPGFHRLVGRVLRELPLLGSAQKPLPPGV